MKKTHKSKKVSIKFVNTIPEKLEDDVIYASMLHKAVMHKCLCGCGEEVSTPLHPTGWEVTYNGEAVSLWPSIGNWSLRCKSHYVIKNNTVIWCREWTREEIEKERKRRRNEILDFYTDGDEAGVDSNGRSTTDEIEEEKKRGIFVKVQKLLLKAWRSLVESSR